MSALKPLLLINGYAASAADWDPGFVAALERTFETIRPDNRGIGASPPGGLDGPLAGLPQRALRGMRPRLNGTAARAARRSDYVLPERMSDAAANKDLVRRFYAEAINERDLDAVDRMLTEDFSHDGERRGRAGQREAVAAFLNGFSDLRNEILLILAEGDLVAAHQRWTGTHDGEFLGHAASGRRVEFTSTAVLRVGGGLIEAAWDQVDLLGLTQQLGR